MYDNVKHAYLDPYQDSFLNDKLFLIRDVHFHHTALVHVMCYRD